MKNDVVRWSAADAVTKCVVKQRKIAQQHHHQQQQQQQESEQQHEQKQQNAVNSNDRLFWSNHCNASNSNSYDCDKTEIGNLLVQTRRPQRLRAPSRSKSKAANHNRRTYSARKSLLCNVLQFSVFVLCVCSIATGVVPAAAATTSSTHDEFDHELSDGNELAPANGGPSGHFTHTWAVHIPNGEREQLADQVARDHGFINMGKIFDDHYHFAHHKVSKRSLTPAVGHQTRLDDDERVHWAKQQTAKSRQKRDFIRMRPSRTSTRAMSLVDTVPFSDPKWSQMWYLNRGGGLDMNVIPAWQEGITGKGIVVTILDDGLESDHPDIEHNYDPKASYDVNSHDDDPMPHYDMTDSNRHGTRCAGEVAATANNTICAVGIAFGASVGGVRMLDGDVTDAVEARSLSLNPQHIDIYSASWGPDDDGKTVDGPGELASRAFIEGVTKGRNGKGSIFIWASGNGGRELDNCNCDGYTNSIWTLSISSATEEGHVPWYSERCSSTLATTYSSGSQSEKQVVTTDLHHSCTVSHTGTSASAPLAAGIAALVLESNQNLTWRDLQHIVVRTAKPANLKDVTWSTNGVGRRVSHSFGYGLMDAAAMVRLARRWRTVPEQQRCEINAPHVDKVIPPRSYITLQLTVKHCLSVNYLEHVQAKITLTSQRRGDIRLYLKSPAGTKVTLLTSRIHDVSRSGFNQWPFMSVHTWGESPHGNWQLEIHNEGRYMGHAQLREWSLIFYGTTQTIDPNDPISTPRSSSAEHTTPNTSSTISSGSSSTTNLHQIYSPQYPRISPNNFGTNLGGSGNPHTGGIGKLPGKLPPNKSVYMGSSSNPNSPSSPATGGKKQQQQYQQISATYGVILGSQSNKQQSGSGGSPKGGGGGGSSSATGAKGKGGGNKSGSGKSTSANKKEQTQGGGGAQNSKNKFYRISQQQQQQQQNKVKAGLASQQQRLKSQSAEKMQSYEDKSMGRKVIGDLPTNIAPKNPLKGSSLSGGGKVAVTKATKQVKDNFAQTNNATNSADQRIPKMFERYEKIQAIFPEFQPYQGKESPNGTSTHTIPPNEKQQRKLYEAETFRPILGVSASKPSRENSKKSSQSFVPDAKILKKQQLLLAAAGLSGGTQRPMMAIMRPSGGGGGGVGSVAAGVGGEIVAAAPASPNRKSTNPNAQITQWELIFYGTDTPAQAEDDPKHLNPDPFGNDMAHNDIDYDANGSWQNMQQVGESSAVSNDKTNSACIKTTADQRCLACAPPTYHYNGRCYAECPVHTYEVTQQPTNVNDDILADSNSNDVAASPNNEINDILQSTDRRKRRGSEVDDMLAGNGPSRQCSSCDASCLRCFGPLSIQCSTCYPGSQLRKLNGNETSCLVFTERSSGLERGGQFATDGGIFGWRSKMRSEVAVVVVLLVSCSVVAAMVAIVVASRRRCLSSMGVDGESETKGVFNYDRLSLLQDDDDDDDADADTDGASAGEGHDTENSDNDGDDVDYEIFVRRSHCPV